MKIIHSIAGMLRHQDHLVIGDVSLVTGVALIGLQVVTLQEMLLLKHADGGECLGGGLIQTRLAVAVRQGVCLKLLLLELHLHWLLRLRNRLLLDLVMHQVLLLLLLLVLQLEQVVLLLLLQGKHLGCVQLLQLFLLLRLLKFDLLLAHRVQFFLLLRLENWGKNGRTVA